MTYVSPLEEAAFNQSPLFAGQNLFALDKPLQDAVARAGVPLAPFTEFGRAWGSADAFEDGRLANENGPKLRIADPKGNRVDVVEFHPAYHAMMRRSTDAGLHCSAFEATNQPSAVQARAALQYMAVGVEAGHMCPITMTHAAIPALRAAAPADLYGHLEPRLLARTYDPSAKPWFEKSAITIGMGMTERQGGTDVRANISRARNSGDHALITGHKWFMSAPMCDAFLVLAQSENGLSCFLVPRHRPDGNRNGLYFRRLKPKLGNISNASSEVEFIDAYAIPIGPEGQGVKTIIEMVQWTRLDCAVSSAGLMRMALAEAMHHVHNRTVFQRKLIDQPLMRAVLADMALELEAMTALVFRLARAFDEKARSETDAVYARLMTPVVKYLVCKRAPQFVYEALECLGGNGYVEELPLARLYREAPLNAIWEGSGNVMALDMLRALGKTGAEAQALLTHVANAADRAVPAITEANRDLAAALLAGQLESRARAVIERLGHFAATAALAEANSPFTELYANSRLAGRWADQFGTIDIPLAKQSALLSRAYAA